MRACAAQQAQSSSLVVWGRPERMSVKLTSKHLQIVLALAVPAVASFLLALANPANETQILVAGLVATVFCPLIILLQVELRSAAPKQDTHRLITALTQEDETDFGFTIIDPDDRVVEINRTLSNVIRGLDTEQITGMAYRDLIHFLISEGSATRGTMSDAERLDSHMEWHANPDRPLFFKSPDGKWARYSEVKMKDGWTVGLFIDVDEQLRREQDLADRESRLSDYAKAASEWFWETDEKHNFTYLSEGFHARTGQAPESVLGKSRREVMERLDTAAARAHLALLDVHLPFYDFRYEATIDNSRPLSVAVSGIPIFSKNGVFQGYRGVARDVSQELMIERCESLAHERLVDAVNSLQAGMMLFDKDRRLVITNSAIRDMYRKAPGALVIGNSIEQVFTAIAASGLIEDEMESEAAWVDDIVAKIDKQDGSPGQSAHDGRLFERRSNATKEGGFIVFEIDVTAQAEREGELQSAKDEAERANRTKTHFLAQMSHELRTPLNSIIGFSEILHDELYGPMTVPQYKEFSKDISDSGRHLLAIINDILDIAKAESGHSSLSPEPVSVHQAVDATIRLVRQRADSGEIQIIDAVPPDLPPVMSEDRLLRQMLINLLSNALKFTDPNGTIRVEGSVGPNNSMRLTVRDTGIGIAPEDIPKALTPFEQVDTALSRNFEGTGLGLPLVKSIMILHHGDLELESAVGVGTAVHLDFPEGSATETGTSQDEGLAGTA